MIDAAHDLSDGGLIQAVVESALLGGKGARLIVPDGLDAFTFLFSESAGRAVVAVPRWRSCASPTCAARGACPPPASASSTATRSSSRASSRSPSTELRDGPRGDDPGAAGLTIVPYEQEPSPGL